jgi:hypothetical protein
MQDLFQQLVIDGSGEDRLGLAWSFDLGHPPHSPWLKFFQSAYHLIYSFSLCCPGFETSKRILSVAL